MSDDVGQTWQAVAPAWEQNRAYIDETTREFSRGIVERLSLRPGMQVLELACGPGEMGFAIAARIAPGTLIQSDLSEAMVAAAARGAESRGVTNIVHRVLDAQALDLPDSSVDAVACRFGFMLMPDQVAAFAETRRVLRTGGRLGLAVWGPPERNMWAVALALPLVQAGKIELRDPTAPGGLFSLSSEERLREALAAGEFSHIEVEEVTSTVEVADLDEWWERQAAIAGPLAASFEALTDIERRAAREMSRTMLEPSRQGDVYRITWTALVASARA